MSDADRGQPGGADNPDAGGGGQDNLGLPEELSNNPSLKKFNDVPTLARSYLELERKLGETVRIPGPNATEEERTAFYKRLGRPDSPDGYALERPQSLPKGLVYDEAFEKTMRPVAHQLGLTQQQVKGLYDWYNGYRTDSYKRLAGKLDEQFKAADTAMRTEWADKYDANRAATLDFIAKQGGKDMVAWFEMHPEVSNDPMMIKWIFGLAQKIAPASAPAGGQPGVPAPEKEGGPGFRLKYNTPMGQDKDLKR